MNIVKFAEHSSCHDHIRKTLARMTGQTHDTHMTSQSQSNSWRRVSGKLTLSDSNADKDAKVCSAIDTVCSGISRMARHQTETKALEYAVKAFIQAISDNLPEQFSYFRFTPILYGSMGEGTKCYQPDEFDFVCKINSDSVVSKHFQLQSFDARFAELTNSNGHIEVVKFAARFYTAVDLTI